MRLVNVVLGSVIACCASSAAHAQMQIQGSTVGEPSWNHGWGFHRPTYGYQPYGYYRRYYFYKPHVSQPAKHAACVAAAHRKKLSGPARLTFLKNCGRNRLPLAY